MSHGGFILAAYGLTALTLLGVVVAIVVDHATLKRALAKFPPRGARDSDEP